jgi:hypothetical protein
MAALATPVKTNSQLLLTMTITPLLKQLLIATSFVLTASLTLFTSCKSTKTIQAAIVKKDTNTVHITSQSNDDSIRIIKDAMAGVKNKQIEFTTFSAKIKAEYEDGQGKQPNITAYVRMIKDSIIWISGYATVFNIEAFRILITKDSVFVLDKINKQAQLRSIDYLQEVTQIPFSMATVQNLLVGNPIFLSDSIVSYKEKEAQILIATLGINFKHLLTLDKQDGYIRHSKLDDLDIARNRTADITYDEYENNNGQLFSTYREVIVSEKNKIAIQMKYKQYEFNKEVQISFNIPKNYKRS